jgi:glycerol uptake facilitator-like aquaporin
MAIPSNMANTNPDVSIAAAPSGTGNKLAGAAITVAGVAALVAALVSFFSIWLQLKSEHPNQIASCCCTC